MSSLCLNVLAHVSCTKIQTTLIISFCLCFKWEPALICYCCDCSCTKVTTYKVKLPCEPMALVSGVWGFTQCCCNMQHFKSRELVLLSFGAFRSCQFEGDPVGNTQIFKSARRFYESLGIRQLFWYRRKFQVKLWTFCHRIIFKVWAHSPIRF